MNRQVIIMVWKMDGPGTKIIDVRRAAALEG